MKLKTSYSLFDILIILILIPVGLITTYPFYYVLIYSLSNPSLSLSGVFLYPKGFTLYNYQHIFTSVDLLQAGLVSVLRTLIGATLTVIGCSVFAYALCDPKTPRRKLIYRISVASMYLSAGLIPWYLTMRFYHLNNTFLLYVIPSTINVFFVMLIKTYFEQISYELKEAAKIDGAGHFRILFGVIMPVSIPILMTIFIFSAVDQWNAWMDNFLLNTKDSLKTLQLVLLEYIRGNEALMESIAAAAKTGKDVSEIAKLVKVTPRSIQMTITMVVVIPIFMVYPFVQRYFMKALLLGAIKG